MLRFLRKYSTSTGIKILYGVLAALFVIWGVGAVGGNRVDVVATVHGEPITRRDVDRATAVLHRRYEELFKDRFSTDLARSLDLPGRALDQLIDDALLRHEADRLGVAVGDGEVVEYITHMPELQEDGRFSRERLDYFLRAQRDRGEFENDVHRSLLFERVRALVTDGVQVSDGELEDRYRFDHDQVKLAFVRVNATELGKAATITDEDLERYLADHGDTYKLPERVRVRYVAYRPADYEGDIQVKDEEVTEFYEQEKDSRFSAPEEIRARHILVKLPAGVGDDAKAAARKEAEDLLAQVHAGKDFAALAKEHSGDPGSAAKGGDLGFFPRGRMTPDFESVAFGLEPGQVSDIVETPFGFHIIKVEERHEGGPKPLDSVRDEIVKSLRHDRALGKARDQAEADRRTIVHGTAFTEALAGRSVAETPLFAANQTLPGLGAGFSEAAFALRADEVSDLVETDDAIYLLTPIEHTEAHVPPLAEIRDQVATDVRRVRGEAGAKEKAEQLRTRAAAVGLEQAATEAGATVEDTDRFDRRAATIAKLGPVPDLRTDAFTLTPEAPVATKVYSAGGDAVVVALREKVPADMSGFASDKDRLGDSLLQQKRQTVLTAFMSFLKERAARDGVLEVQRDTTGRG